MRVLTQAERELERVARVMGTDNANINAIVEKARRILDPDREQSDCIDGEVVSSSSVILLPDKRAKST